MVVFARRLEQMNIPFTAADTVGGVRSDILQLLAPGREGLLLTGWLRRQTSTGRVVYAGCYSVGCVPGQAQPVVKVVFPLPNGSASVFLTPAAGADRSLELRSTGRVWGGDGFYFVVHGRHRQAWVRRVALTERIHVVADAPGRLTTHHEMRLFGRPFLRLHYRIIEASPDIARTR